MTTMPHTQASSCRPRAASEERASDGPGARAALLTAGLSRSERRRRLTDRLMSLGVHLAFGLAVVPLVSLTWMVVTRGAQRFGVEFLTTTMRGYSDSTGGVYHAVIGSLEVTALAAAFSVPLGILTAVFLVEYGGGRLARAVTFLVDVMTGIPSIVAGLFAYSLFLVLAGPRYQAGVIGAVALSVLMAPVVVRGVEEMLRLVPAELREAAYALGVPRWLVVTKVVLREAMGGIVTAVMLAVARVMGETAPLLITMGLPQTVNLNPLEGTMATLPALVYNQYARADAAALERAWAGALTLILIVTLLNLTARLVTRRLRPASAR